MDDTDEFGTSVDADIMENIYFLVSCISSYRVMEKF